MPKTNYDGTTAQTWQIQGGARVKNNAGVLEARNAGDSAYAAAQIAGLTATTGSFSGNVDALSGLDVTGADLTIPDTLSLVFGTGGTGVDGDLYWNGTTEKFVLETAGVTRFEATQAGSVAIKVADNAANGFVVEATGGENFIKVDSTAPDAIELGNATTNPTLAGLGTGAWTLSGNLNANAGVDVAGAALTVANQAITQTTGGQVTFAGNVDANAGVDITGGALTVANQAITQTTGGQVTFAGNVDATNGLDVTTAALTAAAGLTVSGGAVSLTGASSVTVPTPTAGTHAVTKDYADAIVSGLSDFKDSCRVATTAALPAVTAAGSGVGKTLTANAVGVLTVDGVATVLNDRILVKNQAAGADNGLYKVTTEGTASVAFVLTRATDADANAELNAGTYTFVDQGTTNADSSWVCSTNDPITVDTTSLTFTQFSGLGQVTAGAGLTKTGNTLDVVAVDTSITVNADSIQVNAGLGLGVSAGLNVQYGAVGAITTVNAGDAASAGVANTAARGDHEHGVATAIAVAVGTALAEGTSTSLARADHVHELGVGSIDAANLFVAGVVDAAAIATAAVNAAEVGTGPEVAIRFTVGTATADSTTVIPAGARVMRSRTQVTTPYSAGGTLDIGSTASASLYQTAGTDIDEQTADTYDKHQDTAAGNTVVRATVGGAPAAGAATVTVWYVTAAA